MSVRRTLLDRFGRWTLLGLMPVLFWLSGCSSTYPPLPKVASLPSDYYYVIGPGDSVDIFVWGNPEVSGGAAVGPDGRITTRLVEGLPAIGKTAAELARDIEKELAQYIKNPLVTVIVSGFQGPSSEQVRVLGEATNPQSLPYRINMTLLDLMISVGGLSQFADGNAASVVRVVDGEQMQFNIRIDDLLDGDFTANVDILPGDVILIPEAYF